MHKQLFVHFLLQIKAGNRCGRELPGNAGGAAINKMISEKEAFKPKSSRKYTKNYQEKVFNMSAKPTHIEL
jgi:hypothetical protein